MKRILFISHEAARTGAPILLLHLLRWYRSTHPTIRTEVLTLAPGELMAEFHEASEGCAHLLPEKAPIRSGWRGRLGRLFQRSKENRSPRELQLQALALSDPDVVHANTVLSLGCALQFLDLMGKPAKLVLHVHELQTIIREYVPNFQQLARRVDHFIAASVLVRDELVDLWGIDVERIDVVYEFTRIKAVGSVHPVGERAVLHVGGSGTAHWRKGDDLFLQLALHMRKHHPTVPVHFTWVGFMSHRQQGILDGDLRKTGLGDRVRFIGATKDPQDTYASFDLFALTSREDPFPLVCIEVGMLGRPILCFDKATGTAEVLNQGGGQVVPYLDVGAMADAIAAYHHDRSRLQREGERARELFSRFTPDLQCPAIHACLLRACEV